MKEIIPILLAISAIMIIGCGNDGNICDEPFRIIDNECCIDSNNNSICDNDESEIEEGTDSIEREPDVDIRFTQIKKELESSTEYSYTKIIFKSGLNSDIEDTYKVFFKDEKSKHIYGSTTYYIDADDNIYKYDPKQKTATRNYGSHKDDDITDVFEGVGMVEYVVDGCCPRLRQQQQ